MTASLEAAVEAEVGFVAEAEVASEASAPSLREAAWERTRPFPVWGGCLRGGAWEAGL